MLHSLVLRENSKVLFSSKKAGLKPLVECVNAFRGKAKGCELYDRVVGLAAAKLIAYSGFVVKVSAFTASENSLSYLLGRRIEIRAESVVKSIMNNDRTDMCPFEKKAIELNDGEFLEYANEHLGLL